MTDRVPRRRQPKCPICDAGPDAAFRPFCSKRCADVDLGRWLTGSYAIAGRANDEEADQASEEPVDKMRH
jgi:uncharacterized protein